MRHALAALLFATPICAFAVPALAQTDYQPNPVGAVIAAPFQVAGAVISAPFSWMNGANTEAATTGAPAYSYSTMPPSAWVNGYCDIISGNRICFVVTRNVKTRPGCPGRVFLLPIFDPRQADQLSGGPLRPCRRLDRGYRSANRGSVRRR